jgi:hypothetical protein
VQSVFATETAVLVHLKSVWIVLLVFLCVIISLFAFRANQCNFDSHLSAPPNEIRVIPVNTSLIGEGRMPVPENRHTKKALDRGITILSQKLKFVNSIF